MTDWPMRQTFIDWGLEPCRFDGTCTVLVNPAAEANGFCARHLRQHRREKYERREQARKGEKHERRIRRTR